MSARTSTLWRCSTPTPSPTPRAGSPSISICPTTSPATGSWRSRWRGAERFGTAESAITARLPLQVRPSAPRFLNYGDEFELPIIVQNQTDSSLEVDVVVQTSNLELAGSPGRRVTVPANDRVEVRFPARTDSPGTARFRAAAVSGDHADAQIVALPVYTPATTEAFATYGVVDEGAVVQPVDALRGRDSPVRRARDQHLIDRAPGPDRRRAVPRQLPVRQLRCLRQPHPGHLRAARRARGLRGRGSRQPRRTRRCRAPRHRRTVGPPGQRRRLRVVAARPSLEPVPVDPGDACSDSRPERGLHRVG